MSLVPSNVNFLASAASSAAKARRAMPAESTTDSLDVAVALKCIGSYQLQSTPEELRQLDDEDNAAPLIAAARTLQSCAEHLATMDSADFESIDELMLSASIAHAMYGNFPSAKAALGRVSPEYVLATPMRFIASVVCDPTGQLAIQEQDPILGIEGFRWNWFHSLRDMTSEQRNAMLKGAEQVLRDLAVNRSSSSDQALGLSINVAMRQAHRLSTASLYEMAPEIPFWFVERSIGAGIATLLPPQHDLLTRRRVAEASGNCLLTLPTSTGKTFIAEACMASASATSGLSIYIAPYVAIGEQVRASLEAKVSGHISMVSMFGGFKYESLQGTGGRALMVMTPERFDAWLRGGEHLEDLRLVVFDEVHIVENGSRGARVEGLISRLRLLQQRLPQLRILGLSAVLAEPERLCQWMGVTHDNIHRLSWRPTARRIAVCRADGNMHWVHGNDSLRPSGSLPNTPISGAVRVGLPENVVPARNPVTYEAKASRNVAAVAIDLLQRLGWPALVVSPRRADTRLLATALANQLPLTSHEETKQLADSIVARYGWLSSLAACLHHGVAYHNASLPYDVRREIEQATRARKLDIVCSTTTLAEGADLPFRWTLVSHWLGSDGQPLKSMTFRNIAGRNGRAGAFTEGDTILFENTGGSPEAFRGVVMREQLYSVMFSSAPIESTAGDKYPNLREEEQASIRSVFSSQLLASIQENEGADNIAGLLSSATYAVRDRSRGSIEALLNESLAGLLDGSRTGGALAVMNSPVRLTQVGNAANLSGFSPNSARKILEYLADTSVRPLAIELMVQMLRAFSHLDEQQNYLWRKVVSEPGQRHPLKPDDMQTVLTKLAQSQDMRSVFEQLPARARSKAGADNVDKQFDQFVTLIDSLVFNFLPWLLRGLASFSPFGSDAGRAVDWAQLASEVENSFGPQAQEDEPNND
ncbi:DEAD/DEAH box helicase [Sideroxydans sp.]